MVLRSTPLKLFASFLAAGLMAAGTARADSDSFYGGRSLGSGAPAVTSQDRTELALEAGNGGLNADAAGRDGERVFCGLRLGAGFAVEGAQLRYGAPGSASVTELLSVAGVGSVPLSDSVTFLAKVGLHHSQPALAAAESPAAALAGMGKLYGVGVSVQVSENLRLQAQSERLESHTAGLAAIPANTLSLAANVRF